MKIRESSASEARKHRLSSFGLEKPGLLDLLFRRSLIVGIADFLFHIGLFGTIITGAIEETSNFLPDLASVFNSYGWLIVWAHGITGVFLVIGGIGFVGRYLTNRYFRFAYGKVFYLDLAFMVIIAVSGTLQAFAVFGVIAVESFTAYPFKWVAAIQLTSVYVWVVASLFLGGAVRHALATVVWRLTSAEKRQAVFLRFSDACGRCGRCVEVCPLHEATDEAESEAPVVKLRRYFMMLAKKSLPASEVKSIAEQTTACTLCGLCVGVCPFSFNFVDMYKDLLAYAEKVHPTLLLEQHASPQAV
jgi:ferredoxin